MLAEIADRHDCRLLPPTGQARVRSGLVVPADLSRFHDRCGGAILFVNAPFTWYVSGPDRLVAANPRLLTPEVAAQVADEEPDDLTNGCYVIADGGRDAATDPHIVIDLHRQRLGRCYDTFWDRYGLVGDMPVVALTIAELLRSLLATGGDEAVLLARYGDAYD